MTPITRLRFETRPSLAPSTAARRALPPTPSRRRSVARERLGGPARRRARVEVLEQPRVRALVVAELVGRLGLDGVAPAVELLARGERGEQQRRAEAGRQPGEHPRAPARSLGRPAVTKLLELVRPANGVPPLGSGEVAIDAREALFALRGRHRVVQGGAVDLVAVVPPQTLDALAGHGTSRERRVPPAANSESSSTWPALRGSTITGQAASRTTRPATPPTSTECSGP